MMHRRAFIAGAASVLTAPLAIACPDRPRRRYMDITLDSDDSYQLRFLKDGATVGLLDLGPIPEYRRKPGLNAYTLDVPPQASERGFDTIIVMPVKEIAARYVTYYSGEAERFAA